MSKKERLNLVVSKTTRSKIESLQERLDSGTLTEVIRVSVHLLDLISENQMNGNTFIIRAKDGTESELKVVL